MRTIGSAGTYTDVVTAASATAAQYASVLVPQPTLASKNASVTTPLASSLSIQGPPLAGTNQTITNPYAFNVQSGQSRLSGPLVLSQSNTANTVSLVTASVTPSNFVLTLPSTLPSSSGQSLLSDTSGNLSWGSSTATKATFTGANNVTTATSVTGLSVTTSPTVIPIYVQVNATNSLFAIITIRVYLNTNTSSYYLDSDTVGDNTLVRFDVTNAGQVVYYSGNYAGFSSLVLSWFAPFTPIASATSSLSLSSSLSVGTSTTLATSPISGTPSSTTGALVYIQGSTFTDSSTAASGTNANFNATYLAAPTLAATNTAVTTTSANTLAIAGPPTAGANETITNAYSLNVLSGSSSFGGPLLQTALYYYKAFGGNNTVNATANTQYAPTLTPIYNNLGGALTNNGTFYILTCPSSGTWSFTLNGWSSAGVLTYNVYISSFANGQSTANNANNICFDSGGMANTNKTVSGACRLLKGDIVNITTASSAACTLAVYSLGIYQLSNQI